MEKKINISIGDEHKITGILNWKEKSKKLIVFVHGFKGSMKEAQYMYAKDYFIEKGYEVFRFNLYSEGKHKRKLHETSVKEHSLDTAQVLLYFEENYENISVIGHSLGCPTIIGIQNFSQNIGNIIFWDPALNMKEPAEKIFLKNDAYVVPSSGKLVEVSSQMLREFKENHYLTDLQNINISFDKIKIIYASDDRHIKNKTETDHIGIQSYIIEGADHCFTREGNYQKLFEKTLEYLEN